MDAIDSIYAASASPRIKVLSIGDSSLSRLSRAIREIDRTAFEEGTGEVVGPRLAIVKAIRFVLSATPVAGSHESLRLMTQIRKLENFETELKFRASAKLLALFSRLRPEIVSLSQQKVSPLHEKFMEVWTTRNWGKGPYGVVVPDAKAKVATDHWASEIEGGAHLRVLTPAALRSPEFFDDLFLFGAPRWYIRNSGDFLFTTPRASRLSVFGYRWTDLSLNIAPLFHTPKHRPAPSGATPAPAESPTNTNLISAKVEESGDVATDEINEPAFEPPVIDVQAVLRSRRNSATPFDTDEELDSRLVLLAGNSAVLLPFTEDAKSFCADVDERSKQNDESDEDEELASVRRIPNRQLEVGGFILLRTGGGGDLLPIVADSIMGEKLAAGRRGDQREWKQRLRDLEFRLGIEEVCRQLRSNGALRASSTNVRNWRRERTLRPGADEDFRAILTTVDLARDLDRFFQTADSLNSVHHSAGNQIRRLLIAEVRKADLKALRLSGQMTFRLTGVAADASMTAYRIERILPDIVMARPHEVNDVFDQKDSAWL